MERLQVDFAMQRGHEMIIRRDPPFGRADLDEVDVRMLQAARPPGLLKVDWFEMDGCVTFRHAVEGRKMLPHRLIAGPFGMTEYLGFMLGIVEALETCGHYLLRESCCLLEERFLFVGSEWRDVALTYLPLREPPVKRPVREELLALAIRLIGKAEHVDGDAVQTVLRLLDDPGASWPDLRLGLLRLMASDRTFGAGHPVAETAGFRAGYLAGGSKTEGGQARRIGSAPGSPYEDGGNDRRFPPAFGAGGPDTDGAWGCRIAFGADRPDSGNRDPVMEAHDGDAGAGGSARVPHAGPFPAAADGRTGATAESSRAAEAEAMNGKNRFGWLGRFFKGEGAEELPPPETMMFDDGEWPGATGRIRDTGRARWLSVCGAVLTTALIWRYLYLPSPGTDRLLICLGATLLAAGGLVLVWRRLAPGNRGMENHAWSAEGAKAGSDENGLAGRPPWAESGSWAEAGAGADRGIRSEAADIRFSWLTEFGWDDRPASDAAFRAQAGGSGPGETIGLEASSGSTRNGMPGMTAEGDAAERDETVWLQDETVLLDRDDGRLWLVREYEGSSRRIPVERGTHIIGRSEAHAQFVDKAEGVSRAHLEVAFDGSEVRIKDLASRNGTLLGDEIMVPYKEYVLGIGDAFRLAGPDGPKYTLRKSG